MPSLTKTVNVTTVNYETTFYYTIQVSFNGIQGAISSAMIKDFIPNTIDFVLPTAISPVKNIYTTPAVGGTTIIIDFGEVVDLGISATIELECKYNLTAINNTSYTNTAEVWINGSKQLEALCQPVLLQAVPNYELGCIKVLPLSANPAPGQSGYFKFTLQNFGDKGAGVSNIVISAPLLEGMTYDTSFPIKGTDVSLPPYSDPTADGIIGVVSNNVLTFSIPSYKGTSYEFICKVDFDSSFAVGSTVSVPVYWTIDSVEQIPAYLSVTFDAITRAATNGKYGPDYSVPSAKINYELYVSNVGNSALTNFVTADELPSQVQFDSFQTGTFYYAAINQPVTASYTIAYETNAGSTGTVGSFSANVNTTVLFSNIALNPGEYITKLLWNLPQLSIGVTQLIPPKLDGTVKSTVPMYSSFLNHVHSTWDIPGGTDSYSTNKTTIVQNLCVMTPQFSIVSSGQTVYPGSIIRYRAVVDCTHSRFTDPIVAFLLPSTLSYQGNASVTYSNYFPDAPVPVTPPAVVIPNFSTTGKTLVKWQYSGAYDFDFWQRATITIEFDAKVTVGATGSASLEMLLGDSDSNGIIPSGYDIYEDMNDIAGTGVVPLLYTKTRPISRQIARITILTSNHLIKGALDPDYMEEPAIAHTYEGGNVYYKVTITNEGNVDFENSEIVDILPHLLDTGVIETSVQRGSEYIIYNMSNVSASIYPVIPGEPEPVIRVYYSKSYDPVRFGANLQVIGTVNDWSLTPPVIETELSSLKVITQNTKLKPGQTLEIRFVAIAPAGTTMHLTAWNSFAAKIAYINNRGTLQYMLPVEPEKVGVTIVSAENPGKIGGIVWNDINRTGLYEPGEQGINDIVMVLYDSTGTPIEAAVTAPNFLQQDGYYLFNNLPLGKYYVRMIIDERTYGYTTEQVDAYNGSKFSQDTGVTPLIDLNLATEQLDIYGGLIVKNTNDRMEDVLKFNRSAQKVMRSVLYNQMLLNSKLEDVSDLSDIH